jgi:hypothetical protein
MANSTILTYDPSTLPSNMQGNDNHPAADQYIQHLRDTQKAIVAQSLAMKNKKLVTAVKLHHRGSSYADIGREVGHTPIWVSKHIKTAPAQRLVALLAYYQEALDGPNEAQRRAMAWRIAVRNEDNQPKVSMTALAELNKMDNLGKEAMAALTTGDINIVINNNLSRTSLDE